MPDVLQRCCMSGKAWVPALVTCPPAVYQMGLPDAS